jgi:hypothetical protein
VVRAIGLIGGFEEIGERLGPGDLVESLHSLLVFDPVGLHLRDRLAPIIPGAGGLREGFRFPEISTIFMLRPPSSGRRPASLPAA